MTITIGYHESVVARESGYNKQSLWTMRTGQKVGKYTYGPRLKQGRHWNKVGSAVIYTEAGRKLVMGWAEKRKNRSTNA
ncbi:MAG: hypothetical protein HGB02_08710 [Chlorobiaceae bacterium]|nr:hypothetical protein [Chlorobiaceae bacterium]